MEDTPIRQIFGFLLLLAFGAAIMAMLNVFNRVNSYDATTAPYADVVITDVSEQGNTVILTGTASGDVSEYLTKGSRAGHLQVVQRVDNTVKLLLVEADDVSYNQEDGIVYWCNYETSTTGVGVGVGTALTKNVGVGVGPVVGASTTHVTDSGTFVIGDTIHYYTNPAWNAVSYTIQETVHSMSNAIAVN